MNFEWAEAFQPALLYYELPMVLLNNNGDCSKEISRRLAIAIKKLNTMKNIWQSTSKILKLKILRACIFSVATYGCESWTITQKLRTKIQSFETKCYRKILRIPWTEKRKNTDVLKELNVKENWLINNILYRKIAYFGHIKRHDGMERTILEGRVPGRRGRPRRRWLQDIKETMNITINEVGELALQREQRQIKDTYLDDELSKSFGFRLFSRHCTVNL